MKVLFLGPETSGIYKYLAMVEPDLLSYQAPISETYGADIIVSHGYRHKVPWKVLDACPRSFNCHISYLPWNRGADPNLWSWIDDTPKGVTIHQMDEGIDSGPVLLQRMVALGNDGTLRSTYDHLQRELLRMFGYFWGGKLYDIEPEYQVGLYTEHFASERQFVSHLLTEGWDTPVKKLIGALKAA